VGLFSIERARGIDESTRGIRDVCQGYFVTFTGNMDFFVRHDPPGLLGVMRLRRWSAIRTQ
jgi:hypothetical protein